MQAYLDKMILDLAIPFIFRQLAVFRDQIDWNKVEADLMVKVHGHVPKWFEGQIDSAIKFVIGVVKAALSHDDAMQKIISLLVAQQWPQALEALKGFVFGSISSNLVAQDSAKAKELFAHLS